MADSSDQDERIYSSDELDLLAQRNTEIIESWPSEAEPYTVTTLVAWHRRLFSDLRPDFAGKVRSPEFGAKVQQVGIHPSVVSGHVAEELTKHIRSSAYFDQQHAGLSPEEVIRAAVVLHADLIRIQPFHDGNKQIARLAMTYWLRRWKIPVASLSIPREEYLMCVESFLAGDRTCQMLLELMIRVIDDHQG